MTEKPILFSGEMVKAILNGRKTQTRRAIKPQPGDDYTKNSKISYDADGDCIWWRLPGPMVMTGAKNKFGKIGDRLWVKETFQPVQLASEVTQWRYRATDKKGLAPWKPSIFMPRKASRITLEITGIRVERLKDISNEDCFAEGLPADTTKGNRTWYGDLWEEINGKGSWDENPWVWVVAFKKVFNIPSSATPQAGLEPRKRNGGEQ